MIKKFIITSFIVISLGVTYNFYNKIFGVNSTKDNELFIKNNDSFNEVFRKLSPVLKSKKGFLLTAKLMKFNQPKSGRYLIKKGMSNRQIIQKLRIGAQDPIKITFNNQHSLEKLSEHLAKQVELDSLSILNCFLDSIFLQQNQLTKDNVLGIFIPNSYEVYWNTSAQSLRDKLFNAYKHFWNTSRLAKATALNLTPQEVATLASIVQSETSYVNERKTVAGLYLNRLKLGIKLQADPTVIFSLKKTYGSDIIVKRVLNKHLTIKSPYNTYKNYGLPPNLIAMPDISSIDAVLNSEKHDYLYMCASTTNIGQHEFAKTLAQHKRNAKKYSAWADAQGY